MRRYTGSLCLLPNHILHPSPSWVMKTWVHAVGSAVLSASDCFDSSLIGYHWTKWFTLQVFPFREDVWAAASEALEKTYLDPFQLDCRTRHSIEAELDDFHWSWDSSSATVSVLLYFSMTFDIINIGIIRDHSGLGAGILYCSFLFFRLWLDKHCQWRNKQTCFPLMCGVLQSSIFLLLLFNTMSLMSSDCFEIICWLGVK